MSLSCSVAREALKDESHAICPLCNISMLMHKTGHEINELEIERFKIEIERIRANKEVEIETIRAQAEAEAKAKYPLESMSCKELFSCNQYYYY